jgi:hypothetical protein
MLKELMRIWNHTIDLIHRHRIGAWFWCPPPIQTDSSLRICQQRSSWRIPVSERGFVSDRARRCANIRRFRTRQPEKHDRAPRKGHSFPTFDVCKWCSSQAPGRGGEIGIDLGLLPVRESLQEPQNLILAATEQYESTICIVRTFGLILIKSIVVSKKKRKERRSSNLKRKSVKLVGKGCAISQWWWARWHITLGNQFIRLIWMV